MLFVVVRCSLVDSCWSFRVVRCLLCVDRCLMCVVVCSLLFDVCCGV